MAPVSPICAEDGGTEEGEDKSKDEVNIAGAER
jgi:hypothetical protein